MSGLPFRGMCDRPGPSISGVSDEGPTPTETLYCRGSTMRYANTILRAGLSHQLRQRLVMRRTAAELRALSDQSLEDIGMNRADIETMIGR